MVKLIKVAFQKDMIKVNDNGKEMWYECEKAAKGYAKANFKEAICNKENKVLEEGAEIELTITDRDGKPFVTQVRRPGQAPYQGASQATPSSALTTPTAGTSTASRSYGKSPEESALIVRQSTMASASRSVQVLTGQIQDPNVLADVVISIYHKLLAEINK